MIGEFNRAALKPRVLACVTGHSVTAGRAFNFIPKNQRRLIGVPAADYRHFRKLHPAV